MTFETNIKQLPASKYLLMEKFNIPKSHFTLNEMFQKSAERVKLGEFCERPMQKIQAKLVLVPRAHGGFFQHQPSVARLY